MARVRSFDSAGLEAIASSRLQSKLNNHSFFEKRVWQFTILLPRWLLTKGGREIIFAASDADALQALLERHFGGYTWGPTLRGAGKRGIQPETNVHKQVLVLASRWRGTMRYFRALRKELQVVV